MNEKYFLIKVDGIGWGNFERKIYDFKEALKEYENIKANLVNVPCTVTLTSIKIEDDNIIEKEIHKKALSQELDILNILKDMQECIIRFRKACTIHTRNRNIDKDINNIYHGLELIKLSETSGEERDKILYNLEEKLTIRRSGKNQVNRAKKVTKQINNINKTLGEAIKITINAIKHENEHPFTAECVSKYVDYYDSINLDYKEFYDVELIDEVEDLLLKEENPVIKINA